MTGTYALVEGADTKIDAFEVTGGNGTPFALGDMAYADLFESANAAATAVSSLDVGYPEDVVTADTFSYAGHTANDKLFEIDRVDGERYGNIITYGVKLKDGMLGESGRLTWTFNVKWEVNSGDPDYDFLGQFKPADHAPALDLMQVGPQRTRLRSSKTLTMVCLRYVCRYWYQV